MVHNTQNAERAQRHESMSSLLRDDPLFGSKQEGTIDR